MAAQHHIKIPVVDRKSNTYKAHQQAIKLRKDEAVTRMLKKKKMFVPENVLQVIQCNLNCPDDHIVKEVRAVASNVQDEDIFRWIKGIQEAGDPCAESLFDNDDTEMDSIVPHDSVSVACREDDATTMPPHKG